MTGGGNPALSCMEAEDENKDTTHDRYLHDGAATVSNGVLSDRRSVP